MIQKSVLVVEDDLDIRDCLRTILEEDGYEVGEASDGLEALEQLRLRRPCVILLDLNMPLLSGADFLKKVRTLCDIPVLAMSATEPLQKLEGANSFLKKPLDIEVLLKKVKALCLEQL